MRKFGKTQIEQLRLERKRFETRQRPKPVISERIKSKEEREIKKLKKKQETGNAKAYVEELN